ncbi:hypothetical protein ABFS82_06G068200 [Erythranthe guttata]
MASSAEKPHLHHHHLPSTPFATTAAPPPTPATQPNLTSESTTHDFLSHLLHRLPPALSLSLPTRRSSPLSSCAAAATPPMISLSDPTPTLHSSLLSASTKLGFFHLTQHAVSSHLALSAESAAASLFNLPDHQKKHLFPNNWPLGHEIEDDDDDDDESSSATESFCLDSSCSAESENELNMDSLREFTHELEKLGYELVEELASAVGFEKPGRNELCSLMWISEGMNKPGRVYPYALGLHYQIRAQKQSLLSDSGWATVMRPAHSILVTLGDIAHVWSNGKTKKVRGRGGIPISSGGDVDDCMTMSLLITLQLESTVSPLVIGLVADRECDSTGDDDRSSEAPLFNSFSFEEYAWRVYHERLLLKDPLIRYRV